MIRPSPVKRFANTFLGRISNNTRRGGSFSLFTVFFYTLQNKRQTLGISYLFQSIFLNYDFISASNISAGLLVLELEIQTVFPQKDVWFNI